jgi:AraC-like DNA-binding protein
MPALRTVLARDSNHTLEAVSAPPNGSAWGTVHRSPNWRWILPGTGGVQWRGGRGEHLLVDPLTAFHLREGDDYQLQHEGSRSHLVLSTAARAQRGSSARGWLVDPRGLYALKLATRRVSSQQDLACAAAVVDSALAAAVALRADPQPAPLQRARRLLASDPTAMVSLGALGEAAYCSPFHLARLFRRHIGLSAQQYRLRLRLAAALNRLEAGERDLAGLAHDLGFSSQSHFGVLFRREVGVTPAQARRALAGC